MPTPEDTVIRTHADLHDLWRSLMGEDGFAQRSLWMVLLDEVGRVAPVIVPIDGVPVRPDPVFVGNLGTIVTSLHPQGVTGAAFLLSRPGPVGLSAGDRAWFRALHPLAARTGGWPLHLATQNCVEVVPVDDLLPLDAA